MVSEFKTSKYIGPLRELTLGTKAHTHTHKHKHTASASFRRSTLHKQSTLVQSYNLLLLTQTVVFILYSQQFNDLLVHITAVSGPEDAVLLRSLLLDGFQFLEDGGDAEFLFLQLEFLRIAHV